MRAPGAFFFGDGEIQERGDKKGHNLISISVGGDRFERGHLYLLALYKEPREAPPRAERPPRGRSGTLRFALGLLLLLV